MNVGKNTKCDGKQSRPYLYLGHTRHWLWQAARQLLRADVSGCDGNRILDLADKGNSDNPNLYEQMYAEAGLENPYIFLAEPGDSGDFIHPYPLYSSYTQNGYQSIFP